MGAEELGSWEPLTVAAAVELFQPASFRWWLAGGHALEAHFDRSWRSHEDIDIGITRPDAHRLYDLLDGWDIHLAADGVLTPWDGQPLDGQSDHVGNLWCRRSPHAAWALDILIGDGDDHEWIYKRDATIRRPWNEAILTSANGVPYLAPEVQLLFKHQSDRPKDEVDATTVIPQLDSERRIWLALRLPADHAWQTTIAAHRARLALETTERSATVQLLSSGRSSQAWRAVDSEQERVIRVPIPNSGRLVSYRSEVLIGELLADAGHPVSRWHLETVDDVVCSIGMILEGSPVDYHADWSASFTAAFASVLRDLHSLPVTGWGPLADSFEELRGTSESATEGIVDRWFHAAIWPFDGSDFASHAVAALDPELTSAIIAHREAIGAAAAGPFGVVHSDLHNQHLLRAGGELTGVLDFGDAFVGSTAWDFALIHWYYGAGNARRVALAYGSDPELIERAALLAIAVGCYKVAKTPQDSAARARLRSLLSGGVR